MTTTCDHTCCRPLLTPEDSRRLADQWSAEPRAYGAEHRRLLGERLKGLEGWRVLDFSGRVIADALLEASPAHWLRRAADFEACKPDLDPAEAADRPGDVERWVRNHDRAQACRNHATIADVDVQAELERDTAAVIDELRHANASEPGAAA